jgi:sortase A
MPTPAHPTRIVIPAIDVDAPIIPISWSTTEVNGQSLAAWEVPATYAAGWHNTSAPLESAGNTVINGHNTTHGEVFRDLYRLRTGDTVVVYSDDVLHTYAVSETLILREAGQPLEKRIENARYILPTDDRRLTLVTCHPYGSLRYRLIVIAHPIANLEEEGHLLIPAERLRFY